MKTILKILLGPMLIFCLFLIFGHIKQAHASHSPSFVATGLTEGTPTCVSGRVQMTFSWHTASDFPGVFTVRDLQFFDISTDPTAATNPNSASWLGADVGVNTASYTATAGAPIGTLTPGVPHWWRVNTRFTDGQWHPSTVEPFTTITCTGTSSPPPGGMTLTATVSGLHVTFTMSQPTNSSMALIVYDSSNNVVHDSGPLSGTSYIWDLGPSTISGSFHAQVFAFGTTPFSTVATFTLGSGSCSVADVNGDGNVDVEDQQEVALHVLPTTYDPKYDVDGDGDVDTTDVTFVANCFSPIPPYTGPGGAGCEGFLDCMTSITSPTPTEKFNENGLVGAIFSSILPIIIGLGGFLTVILIVVSGIQFVSSSGNPEAAAAARGRLTFAIIGFALLVLAFAITQIVDNVFLRGSGIF